MSRPATASNCASPQSSPEIFRPSVSPLKKAPTLKARSIFRGKRKQKPRRSRSSNDGVGNAELHETVSRLVRRTGSKLAGAGITKTHAALQRPWRACPHLGYREKGYREKPVRP